MVVVLSAALLFGLIGFAVHILWIVAIVVLALGLGYVGAKGSRRV
jgi:type IV secretory pathway VirB2 component (pilin)